MSVFLIDKKENYMNDRVRDSMRIHFFFMSEVLLFFVSVEKMLCGDAF